jgi:uncharacterized protein YuzE
MRVTYDPKADAAYIYFRAPENRLGAVRSIAVLRAPTMTMLDLDVDGRLFGLEVLNASQALPQELLDAAVLPGS